MRRARRAADLACKHGVSQAPLYNWKAKYGGMDVIVAKRLRRLDDENAKPKNDPLLVMSATGHGVAIAAA